MSCPLSLAATGRSIGLAPITLLLVVLGLGLLAQDSAAQSEFRRGDCNGDSQLDVADAIYTLSGLFVGGPIPCQDACDVNDDGLLDLSDGVVLLSAVFDPGGPVFSLQCEVDATPDSLTCLVPPCRVPLLFSIPGYDTGSDFFTFTTGDVNGDGQVDVVVAEREYALRVFLGNGDGSLTPLDPFLVADRPSTIAAGDFNDDGFADVVVGFGSPDTSSYFESVGDGTFQPPQTFTSCNRPRETVVGDFDNDGHLDFGILCQFQDQVVFQMGDGNGNFTAGVPQPASSDARFVVAGDANSDGTLDLIVTQESATGAFLYLGDGDGTFTPSALPGVCPFGTIGIGDVDGDGISDLLFGCGAATPDTVRLMRGTGGGMFAPPEDIAVPGIGLFVQLADLDSDGNLDFVASAQRIIIGMGIGDGTFMVDSRFPTNNSRVELADFDNDGILDFVAPNVEEAVIEIRRGLPGGEFVESVRYETPSPQAAEATLLDADALPDLVVVAGASVDVYLGSPGGYSFPPASYSAGLDVDYVKIGDLDSDGDNDVLAAGHFGQSLVVMLNDGLGALTQAQSYPMSERPRAVELSDLDADGNLDIVIVLSELGLFATRLGTGGGMFGPEVIIPSVERSFDLVVGDANGDGIPDVMALSDELGGGIVTTTLRTFAGNGDGTFDVVYEDTFNGLRTDLALGDFNEDGAIDLVVESSFTSTPFGVRLGNGDGSFEPASELDFGQQFYNVRVVDIDSDGHEDLIGSGRHGVTILLGDGLGDFSPPQLYSIGYRAGALATVDMDGDTDLDVIGTGFDPDQIYFLENLLVP